MTFWEWLDNAGKRRAARPVSRRLVFRDWLALFLINSFVVSLFYLMGRQFPSQNEQLIVYMLGQLSGFTASALALYFTANRAEEHRTEQRSEANVNLAGAVKDLATTARVQAEGPTGNPGDPVHTVEEKR